MKLSLFYELTTDDPNEPGAVEKRFAEAFEQIEYAEEMGFDGVWCVEHHFLPGYSHLSSPEIFLTAVSQRTKRMRIGTAIMHLPYNINNPIRVAERIATMDIVSGGRIEFGAGRATSMEEFEGFNVDPTLTRAQWAEGLEIIPRMWTEEYFEYESEFIKIPRRRITPKPVQKPHPPLWVACTQPDTIKFAGEHGIGVLGFGVKDALTENFVEVYRDALKNAKPAVPGVINGRFAVMRMALCLPTDEEAIELQEYSYHLFNEQVGNLFAPWIEGKPPPSYEYIIEHFKMLRDHAGSHTLKELTELDETLVGSPETVARALNKMADAGVDEALLFMQGARTPHEKIMESIRLVATEVRPLLHEPATVA
jgi:alkanesulfonate monooxygenase SsuD/methylene tetrahydromethanopterin reductase-like flavin-dependent oxidoreductase (luciferase family)